MTLRHYEPVAADCPRFSPGWSFTTDISEDMDCPECLAALESEGRGAGCDHDEPCGCYGEGYAAGRGKAFFEMEVWEPEGPCRLYLSMLPDGAGNLGQDAGPCMSGRAR